MRTELARVFALLVVGLAIVALPFQAFGQASPPVGGVAFEFGLFGDMPYSQEGLEKLPNLIADINAHDLAFVVFDGDFKSGSWVCSDEWFEYIRDQFNSLRHPLIFVPGDNEWTDCHRPQAGGYDPLERLARLREMFFPDEMSLGSRRIPLQRQSDDLRYAAYRENVRWKVGEVTFLGLNVPGSNNNLQRNLAMAAEFFEREEATIAFMRETFERAHRDGSRALLIVIQANPGFELFPELRTGFNGFLDALEAETIAFSPRPVVLVHGDSHYFRIDKPFKNSANRRMLENFTRVETFGEDDIHWVRGSVDYADPGVFMFRPSIVRENLVRHR